jgi:HlyD family secretion protein
VARSTAKATTSETGGSSCGGSNGSSSGNSGGSTSGSGSNGSSNTGGNGSGASGSSGSGTGGSSGSGTGGSSGGSGGGTERQGDGTDAILSAQQRVISAGATLAGDEDALAGATMTAPIAGKVLSVAGKVGSQVEAGSTFVTVADTGDMLIEADFPEADADHLAVGQAATVALPAQDDESFKATVTQVDPTGSSDGTMVRFGVVLAFVDKPADLLVGQSAVVTVTTGSKSDVLRVPSTAVHNVAGASGTVQVGNAQVTVGVGLRGDQYTEITSGLAEGDEVTRSW